MSSDVQVRAKSVAECAAKLLNNKDQIEIPDK